MKLICLFFLVFLSSCSSIGEALHDGGRIDKNNMFSVLQGATDETSTIIRIVHPGNLTPKFMISDSKNRNIKITTRKSFDNDYYDFKVVHLTLTQLDPKELYTLSISAQTGKWQDERTFQTLKNSSKLKVLVASCMSDTYNDVGNIIWPEAYAHNQDVNFFIGDNLYADIYSGIFLGKHIPTRPGHLWRRHVDHAITMKVYRLKRLVPTFATWDDHDYGVNDGDKTYQYREKAKEFFRIFFPSIENKNVKHGYGVGSVLTLSNQKFYFLDGRYFRDPNDSKNGYHLGKEQRQWLKKELSQSNKLNWLILGDQFFGGYSIRESFQGRHADQFKNFTSELKSLNKKYFLVSGDRHFQEVMKIPKTYLGHETYEFTISGMHTKTYSGALEREPNPLRIDGFDGKVNYGVFTIDSQNEKTNIHFEGYTLHKKLIDKKISI